MRSVCRRMPREVQAHGLLLRQRLVQVLQAGARSGARRSRRRRLPSDPRLKAALSTRKVGSTRPRARSSPAPSAPSMADVRSIPPVAAVTGVGAVAAQAEAVEAAGLAEARRSRAGTSHSVIGPSRGQRPAAPHVAVGLTGRRDPALLGVQAHVAVGRRGGAQRRPEVAARAGFGKRQRAQVPPGGDRPRGSRAAPCASMTGTAA